MNVIAIFKKEIDDSEFGLYEARKAYNDLGSLAMDIEIFITEKEIELYRKDFVKALDIINEENDSMIGTDEDDIFYYGAATEACYIKISKLNTCSIKTIELIRLFQRALEMQKNICFFFPWTIG